MSQKKKMSMVIFLLVGVSLLFSKLSQQETAKELFEKAVYLEETKGDLEKAIAVYDRIIKEFPDDRAIAAKAQLQIGMCFEKLGLKEAEKAFQKVVDNYPDQQEAVKTAQEKLSILQQAKAIIQRDAADYKVTKLYESKWLHGIEVANGDNYYPEAHKWCLEKKLTMMANSDIHAPSLITKTTPENHRTITLVFAKERTLEAVRQAFGKGRTAVWYKNRLIGKDDWLDAIFRASVKVVSVTRKGRRKAELQIANNCHLNIRLRRTGEMGPDELLLPAGQSITFNTKITKKADRMELAYTAENMLVAPEKGLPVKITAILQ